MYVHGASDIKDSLHIRQKRNETLKNDNSRCVFIIKSYLKRNIILCFYDKILFKKKHYFYYF